MKTGTGESGPVMMARARLVPAAFRSVPPATLLDILGSSPDGLTDLEAAEPLRVHGTNRLASPQRSGILHELLRQFTHPIVLILIAATVPSFVLGASVDAVITLGIVVLGGLLSFWQERGANATVARLLTSVQVHVDVERSGRVLAVPPEVIVPGDVLVLNAGDIVPCDCRVLTAAALQLAGIPAGHWQGAQCGPLSAGRQV